MTLFIQQVINGIMLGSVYSLVALGLTLIYGILHIPNFAHGHKYMLGGYITFFLISIYHFNYWLAILASMLVMAVVGALAERLVYRPLRNTPEINYFIAAIGLLMILESGAYILFGPSSRQFPAAHEQLLNIFGATVTMQRLYVIGCTVVLIVILQLFIKKTTTGATIEAMAQNREGALLVGIDINRVATLTFAIGTGLAAAAAGLVGPVSWVYPTMGAMPNLKAFVIIILGGMGSLPGAVVGGYILGLMEALCAGYVSANYEPLFAFGVLIAILAFKPTGLFGKA
ncbi:MAG: branched-chain amino acid ABC transporter permease [Pseudomonadota bacterium]